MNVPGGADVFFFNDTATTEIYALSLHDALPILKLTVPRGADFVPLSVSVTVAVQVVEPPRGISGAAQLTTVVVVRAATVIRAEEHTAETPVTVKSRMPSSA